MTSMEDEMQELREIVAQLRADNDRLRRVREQVPGELPGPSTVNGVASTASLTLPSRSKLILLGRSGLFVCLGTDDVQNLVANPASVLTSGWRRLRRACGFVICLKRIKHFFSSTTWKVKRGRRLGTVPGRTGRSGEGYCDFT